MPRTANDTLELKQTVGYDNFQYKRCFDRGGNLKYLGTALHLKLPVSFETNIFFWGGGEQGLVCATELDWV